MSIDLKLRVRRSRLRAIAEKMRALPGRLRETVAKTASDSFVRTMNATPVRMGKTRQGWVFKRTGELCYSITNSSIVMRWLEHGTKAHGPVTAQTQRPWANDRSNVQYGRLRLRRGLRYRAKRLFIPLTVAAADAYATRQWGKLAYGVDYVLAKRVRGIRAMHIAEKEQRKVNRALATGYRKLVRETFR